MTHDHDPNGDDRLDALALRYLDGDATEAEHAELERLLADDDAAVERLLELSTQRLELRESLRRRSSRAVLESELIAVAASDTDADDAAEARDATPLAKIGPRIRWGSAALAAGLLIAATLGLWAGGMFGGAGTAGDPMPTEALRIGVVTGGGQAMWQGADSTEPVGNGQRLRTGRLAVSDGEAEVQLDSGVTVSFVGPVEARVVDTMHLDLESGRATVTVPPGAEGFVVDAGGVRIVDLGTVFSVSVTPEGEVDVRVISGRVEARLPGEADAPAAPVRLYQPAHVRLNPQRGTVQRFDELTGKHQAPIAAAHWPLRDDGTVRFRAEQLRAYADQDGYDDKATDAEVIDAQTLHVWGNAWRRLDVDYTVTARTVLEFEFRSDRLGEMHGVALDDDNVVGTGRRLFVIAGDDRKHPAGWHEYRRRGDVDGWATYRIPVGRHYTGPMRQLVFFADDDARGRADSWFRNVRVYEDENENGPEPHERNTEGAER